MLALIQKSKRIAEGTRAGGFSLGNICDRQFDQASLALCKPITAPFQPQVDFEDKQEILSSIERTLTSQLADNGPAERPSIFHCRGTGPPHL